MLKNARHTLKKPLKIKNVSHSKVTLHGNQALVMGFGLSTSLPSSASDPRAISFFFVLIFHSLQVATTVKKIPLSSRSGSHLVKHSERGEIMSLAKIIVFHNEQLY